MTESMEVGEGFKDGNYEKLARWPQGYDKNINVDDIDLNMASEEFTKKLLPNTSIQDLDEDSTNRFTYADRKVDDLDNDVKLLRADLTTQRERIEKKETEKEKGLIAFDDGWHDVIDEIKIGDQIIAQQNREKERIAEVLKPHDPYEVIAVKNESDPKKKIHQPITKQKTGNASRASFNAGYLLNNKPFWKYVREPDDCLKDKADQDFLARRKILKQRALEMKGLLVENAEEEDEPIFSEDEDEQGFSPDINFDELEVHDEEEDDDAEEMPPTIIDRAARNAAARQANHGNVDMIETERYNLPENYSVSDLPVNKVQAKLIDAKKTDGHIRPYSEIEAEQRNRKDSKRRSSTKEEESLPQISKIRRRD